MLRCLWICEALLNKDCVLFSATKVDMNVLSSLLFCQRLMRGEAKWRHMQPRIAGAQPRRQGCRPLLLPT